MAAAKAAASVAGRAPEGTRAHTGDAGVAGENGAVRAEEEEGASGEYAQRAGRGPQGRVRPAWTQSP